MQEMGIEERGRVADSTRITAQPRASLLAPTSHTAPNTAPVPNLYRRVGASWPSTGTGPRLNEAVPRSDTALTDAHVAARLPLS